MATQGPFYPSTTVNDNTVGSVDWGSPNNAQVDDNVYSTGGFGNSGGTIDNSAKIVKGGTIGGTEKAGAGLYNTSPTYNTYGGASDLWGQSWSAADINASTFGFALSINNTGTKGDPNELTHYLKATGFGFSIPNGSVINGIAVESKNKTTLLGAGFGRGDIDDFRITVYYTAPVAGGNFLVFY